MPHILKADCLLSSRQLCGWDLRRSRGRWRAEPIPTISQPTRSPYTYLDSPAALRWSRGDEDLSADVGSEAWPGGMRRARKIDGCVGGRKREGRVTRLRKLCGVQIRQSRYIPVNFTTLPPGTLLAMTTTFLHQYWPSWPAEAGNRAPIERNRSRRCFKADVGCATDWAVVGVRVPALAIS